MAHATEKSDVVEYDPIYDPFDPDVIADPYPFYARLRDEHPVYYNEREKLFKVAPKGLQEDGFLRCVDMRQWSKNPDEYDTKIKNLIEMQEHECMSNESHDIWKHF